MIRQQGSASSKVEKMRPSIFLARAARGGVVGGLRHFLPMTWKETEQNADFSARHSKDQFLLINMVKEIASQEEFDKVIADSGDKLVAVDYTASWCG